MSDTDELAEINGLKPKVWLTEGDQRIVNSMTSSSMYKVKRTLDHFYCDCMAWRNQKAPINARSCKHLKELLGAEYEEARCEFKDPEGYAERAATRAKGAKGKKAPAPKKAAAGKKRKAAADDDDDEDEAPRKKAKASTTKAKTSKSKSKDLDDEDEDDVPAPKVKSGTSKAKASKKSKDYDDDDDEAEEDEASAPKKSTSKAKPASKPAAKKKSAYDDDDDDDEESKEESTKKPASSAAKKFIPNLLLANKYDLEKGPDPKGWWCSEKLDGVRAYYDKIFLSRQGNEFFAPDWFMDALPKDVQLDGELFGGRGQFNSTVSIVRTKSSPHWKSIKYYIFDIPSHGSKPFEDRMKLLEGMFGKNGTHQSDHIVIVDHTLLKSREQMDEMLEEVQKQGGEGLMLRKPGSTYQGTRSSTLLKVKTFHDAEARVIGYKDGRGKNLGVTGALVCEMESKKTFQCGSGLTDAQRKHPPKIGSIIVYKFMEITASGVPRHPTFVGEAADKTEPKDADLGKPVVTAEDDNEEEDMEE